MAGPVARQQGGDAQYPPLPDDAKDALINAMGTPEEHDARMRAAGVGGGGGRA